MKCREAPMALPYSYFLFFLRVYHVGASVLESWVDACRCRYWRYLEMEKRLSRARVCLQTWIFWKWTHLSKMKHSGYCHRRSLCRIISSRQWHTFVPSDYWGLVHGAWTVHGAHSGHAGLQSHRNAHKDITPEDFQGLKGSRNVNKHGHLFMQQKSNP